MTKSGTGTWTVTNTNTYSGPTTINAGTLSVADLQDGGTNSNIGKSSSAATNLVLGGGTLSYTGATQTINRAFTLTAATIGTFDVTQAGTTLTLAGNAGVVTTGGLAKTGLGTLAFTGPNSYNGTTTINGGTLFLNGNTTTTTGQYLVGNAASSKAILQIATGTSLTSTNTTSAMRVGVGANSVGVVNQNGGTVTLGTVASDYNLALGGDSGATNGANTNYNFGAYNLNGGTASAWQTEVGDSGGTGMMTITDGTFGNATGARYIIIGRFGNSTGVVTLAGTGGATPTLLGAASSAGIGMGWQDNSSNNRQELNIGNLALVNASAAAVSNGLTWRAGTGTNNVGIANLLTGGTLRTGYIGITNGAPTAIFNFNGGTVVSTQTSTTFATTLTSAYVYPGGRDHRYEHVQRYGAGPACSDRKRREHSDRSERKWLSLRPIRQDHW